MSSRNPVTLDTLSVKPVYLSARSAIITPEMAIPVTLYSLKKWLPRLGPGRWSLVQLLRGLSLDAPRRTDGTKRVTISWRLLAERLQIHEETVASWLKHEVIPDDKPWRRVIPVDDYAQYLSIFVPRLRYAYETSKGKTRRVGFLLEVLMEDPVAPEDEIRLSQQVELLQLQQGELGLDTYRQSPDVNRGQSSLQELSTLDVNGVTTKDTGSPQVSVPKRRRLTGAVVNPDKSDLPLPVKQYYVDSALDVTIANSDSHYGKSEWVTNNVNKLKTLITKLKQLKQQKRNYQQIIEPVITLTEALLDDYHSTAMMYKVLKILFPKYTDIYILAVEEALTAYSIDESVNRGAIFVRELRELSNEANVDLGFRNPREVKASPLLQNDFSTLMPASEVLEASLEDIIWSETLSLLQGQMTKAMFNSVMQGTRLDGAQNGAYVVQVANDMTKDWLDNRLRNVVERALSSVVGHPVRVEFRA